MCTCSTGLNDWGDALCQARKNSDVDKEFKKCKDLGRTFPVVCEVHRDKYKEFLEGSGRDNVSSAGYPHCTQQGEVPFTLSKSIYHFSYLLISRAAPSKIKNWLFSHDVNG